MERYEEENEEADVEVNVLSRERRNQDIYNNAYLNSSVVDISNILPLMDDEEKDIIKEDKEIEPIIYEEKSYDVNEYLKKAHEKYTTDDAKRDLDQEFQNQEDEIRKLISAIDEKEDIEDIFDDLRGENEDTMIGGKLKTDDFDTNIYEILKEDEERIKLGNTVLKQAISDETLMKAQLKEEEMRDHSFDGIEDQSDNPKKRKKLPIIIFVVSLLILIGVVLYILLK